MSSKYNSHRFCSMNLLCLYVSSIQTFLHEYLSERTVAETSSFNSTQTKPTKKTSTIQLLTPPLFRTPPPSPFKTSTTPPFIFISMICTRCLLQRRAAANATSLLHPPTLLAISSRSYSLRPLCFSPLSSRRLSRYLSSFSSPLRQETITITTAATTTTTTTAAAPSSSPPFSTPFTPGNTPSSGSGSPATTTAANTPPQKQHPRSKTPAGVPLKGLGYLKNQETPKAWADDEYPEWLWGLLNSSNEGGEQEGIGSGAAGGKGDFYCEFFKFVGVFIFFFGVLGVVVWGFSPQTQHGSCVCLMNPLTPSINQSINQYSFLPKYPSLHALFLLLILLLLLVTATNPFPSSKLLTKLPFQQNPKNNAA